MGGFEGGEGVMRDFEGGEGGVEIYNQKKRYGNL